MTRCVQGVIWTLVIGKKILLDYEIVTDKEFAKEYGKHVKKFFYDYQNKSDENNLRLLDIKYVDYLKKNGIDVINC